MAPNGTRGESVEEALGMCCELSWLSVFLVCIAGSVLRSMGASMVITPIVPALEDGGSRS